MVSFVPASPLSSIKSYFLYCEGITPYISLKYLEKYLGLLNPTL